jgi:hypothetical protein
MVYRTFAVVLVALAVTTFSIDAGGGKKAAKEPGTIEVYKGAKGYRYRIKDAEGKTVAMPLPNMHWDKKEECLEAIEEVKTILAKVKPVDVKE